MPAASPEKSAVKPEPKGFIARQYEFAAHIRDPQTNPRPSDVEDRRMAIYRELFFNNVNSLLESCFPVLRSLFEEAKWEAIARDFFAHHASHTPYFLELGQEFLAYLQERRDAEDDPPFMTELAHYEWVELALDIDTTELHRIPAIGDGDLLHGCPVASPIAWPLMYAFPVHRIGPEHQPEQAPAQATTLIVYRDTDDDVRFIEATPATARLLELCQSDDALTGLEILDRLAAEMGVAADAIREFGLAELERLRDRGILLGTRPQA
ncbi:MAG: putative DNA-binding domain-containing protein [Gammaproteobacteria bacterium]|nr:putative DNA-binding domain-containing protein [Gammaproteobacteria bacterium]MCP5137982.1 putative DNA-binding domain-containing protein [Gammaproteobacteria bacterium]